MGDRQAMPPKGRAVADPRKNTVAPEVGWDRVPRATGELEAAVSSTGRGGLGLD